MHWLRSEVEAAAWRLLRVLFLRIGAMPACPAIAFLLQLETEMGSTTQDFRFPHKATYLYQLLVIAEILVPRIDLRGLRAIWRANCQSLFYFNQLLLAPRKVRDVLLLATNPPPHVPV